VYGKCLSFGRLQVSSFEWNLKFQNMELLAAKSCITLVKRNTHQLVSPFVLVLSTVLFQPSQCISTTLKAFNHQFVFIKQAIQFNRVDKRI